MRIGVPSSRRSSVSVCRYPLSKNCRQRAFAIGMSCAKNWAGVMPSNSSGLDALNWLRIAGFRIVPNGNRSRPIRSAEKRRAIQRADADCRERRESTLYQQLDLVLIGVAGDDTPDSGWIGAGEQHSTRARERQLQRARFGEERAVR